MLKNKVHVFRNYLLSKEYLNRSKSNRLEINRLLPVLPPPHTHKRAQQEHSCPSLSPFTFFFTVIEQQEAKTELFLHVSKRHVNFYVYVDKENIYDSALFKKRKL